MSERGDIRVNGNATGAVQWAYGARGRQRIPILGGTKRACRAGSRAKLGICWLLRGSARIPRSPLLTIRARHAAIDGATGAASLIVKADIWGLWRVSPHADRPAHEGLMPFRIRLCSWRSQGRMGFPTYRAYRTRKGNNDKGRREGRPLFVFFVCALTDPLVAGRAVLPKIQGFP